MHQLDIELELFKRENCCNRIDCLAAHGLKVMPIGEKSFIRNVGYADTELGEVLDLQVLAGGMQGYDTYCATLVEKYIQLFFGTT